MAVTETTLAFFLGMLGIITSLIIACIGRKKMDKLTKVFILTSFVIIPIVMLIAYNMLSIYVTIWDWMRGAGRYAYIASPSALIIGACLLGGFLGIYAGHIWEDQGTQSCLGCMLVPILIITAISFVLLILP